MKLYRYWSTDSSNNDYDLFPEYELLLKEYEVIRETEKCYVINDGYDIKDKLVLKEAKKRFAYPEKEMALKNYIERTKKYITIMGHNTEKAKECLEQANKIK